MVGFFVCVIFGLLLNSRQNNMNICIGGDLDGQVVDLGKARFNASEVDKNKS